YSRNKSYYPSYFTENGNIKCTELPPYADTNKAQACYWDGKKWVFDADKYAEIKAFQTAEREAAEQAKRAAEAVPTNEELAAATMEIADNVSFLMEATAEIAGKVAVLMEGGE
ncbi:MAG: hypothetical protein K2H91_01920, partial [Lachnospiraceae bacterium]|nr:hypothetical protein [Lachnospiraceae bacterium]